MTQAFPKAIFVTKWSAAEGSLPCPGGDRECVVPEGKSSQVEMALLLLLSVTSLQKCLRRRLVNVKKDIRHGHGSQPSTTALLLLSRPFWSSASSYIRDLSVTGTEWLCESYSVTVDRIYFMLNLRAYVDV